MYDLTTLQIMNSLKRTSPRLMAGPETVLHVLRARLFDCIRIGENIHESLENDLRAPITDGEWQSQPPEKRTWQKHVQGL